VLLSLDKNFLLVYLAFTALSRRCAAQVLRTLRCTLLKAFYKLR